MLLIFLCHLDLICFTSIWWSKILVRALLLHIYSGGTRKSDITVIISLSEEASYLLKECAEGNSDNVNRKNSNYF